MEAGIPAYRRSPREPRYFTSERRIIYGTRRHYLRIRHRACKAAPRVAVYTHKDAVQLAARLRGERIHRIEALELYAMDFDWLSDLAQRLQRRTQFTLTVSEQHLYLSLGEETLSAVVNR